MDHETKKKKKKNSCEVPRDLFLGSYTVIPIDKLLAKSNTYPQKYDFDKFKLPQQMV